MVTPRIPPDEFYARLGRELIGVVVRQIKARDDWKGPDLVRFAELARVMETGSSPQRAAAGKAAASLAGVDEWDRLAADLAATVPDQP